MANRRFTSPLKRLIKSLAVLLIGVITLLGFSPAAALAHSLPNQPIALAASSRFAAQAEAKDQEPIISESKLSELREKRREWQSEVSAAAAEEAEEEATDANGVVEDPLNLREIKEENEIVDRLIN